MNNALSDLLKIKTTVFTAIALTAFAANSVLCRMALGGEAIDAASFTVIRLIAGAVTMGIIAMIATRKPISLKDGSWKGAIALFIYAATFSYAYISLDTGTGALILFGAVQLTMIIVAISTGEKLTPKEWAGVFTAFAGFVFLVAPGVSTPSWQGFILMTAGGVAWGAYTLFGKESKTPLADTACNFIRTAPFVIALSIATFSGADLSQQGVILAILSGSLASGVGYAIWYNALKGLTKTQAAVVQLLVPVFAAAGGVLLMSEVIGVRLAVSSSLILGGILLVVMAKR